MDVKTYPYKQKMWIGPACTGFFGLCAWVFWQKSHQEPRGLIINHIIELSPGNALIFHWLLFFASMAFVVLGLMVSVMSLKKERHITLTSHSLQTPKSGISNTEVEILFRNITAIQLHEVQGQRFLQISHGTGKTSIAQSMLPTKAAFDEICAFVAAHVRKPH